MDNEEAPQGGTGQFHMARDVRTGRTLGEQFLESANVAVEYELAAGPQMPRSQYDLMQSQFTRVESPDARIDLAEEEPMTEMRIDRGPIRYQVDPEVQRRRAVERLVEQVGNAAQVPVYLSIGDGHRTDLGTYDAREGNAGLARLLRAIAIRLAP